MEPTELSRDTTTMMHRYAPLVRADDPCQLWNWVLARQGVYSGNGLSDVHAVLDRTLGLHAARIQTPFITAAARLSDPTRASSLLGALPQHDLMTLRGVRRTLHVMTPDHASLSHGATAHYRTQGVISSIRRQSLSLERIRVAAKDVVASLALRGSASERELESLLSGSYTKYEVRLALKLSWEAGDVAFHNASGSWDALRRTFHDASVWHSAFDSRLPRGEATIQLLGEYLERYGPATLLDAAWWAGMGQSSVVEAFRSVPLVRLDLPWAAADFFMTEKAWVEFQDSMRKEEFVLSGVALLGKEDCALKAYKDSRDRYLFGQDESVYYNSIGEVRPTILKDGHVAGTWGWDRKALQVNCLPQTKSVTVNDRSTVSNLAKDLSELLRRNVTPIGRFGSVEMSGGRPL